MSVINYLASTTLELRMTGLQGVDSLGIKWSGEGVGGMLGANAENTPEPAALDVPETIRRPLGWK